MNQLFRLYIYDRQLSHSTVCQFDILLSLGHLLAEAFDKKKVNENLDYEFKIVNNMNLDENDINTIKGFIIAYRCKILDNIYKKESD